MNVVNIPDPPSLDLATENPKPTKHNRAFHTKNLNYSHGRSLTPNPTNLSAKYVRRYLQKEDQEI
jgi:hypothetical protein